MRSFKLSVIIFWVAQYEPTLFVSDMMIVDVKCEMKNHSVRWIIRVPLQVPAVEADTHESLIRYGSRNSFYMLCTGFTCNSKMRKDAQSRFEGQSSLDLGVSGNTTNTEKKYSLEESRQEQIFHSCYVSGFDPPLHVPPSISSSCTVPQAYSSLIVESRTTSKK